MFVLSKFYCGVRSGSHHIYIFYDDDVYDDNRTSIRVLFRCHHTVALLWIRYVDDKGNDGWHMAWICSKKFSQPLINVGEIDIF